MTIVFHTDSWVTKQKVIMAFRDAGICCRTSWFGKVSLLLPPSPYLGVSFQHSMFFFFFSGSHMHSKEMHTAVISLFIYIHCCSDDFEDIYFSGRFCVYVLDVWQPSGQPSCQLCEWGSVMRNAYQASTACKLSSNSCCPRNPTGRPRVLLLVPNIPIFPCRKGAISRRI